MTHLSTSLADREIERLASLHPKRHTLSLDRITALLGKLGNPERKLPPVIHIAGTNGKGSASAFCRALLEAAGYAVHVHTSPHLVKWHERYRLGVKGGRGRYVEDEVLAEVLRRIEAANDGQPITLFEILTAATFVLFSEHPADAVVMEVGLGGRHDATNVVESPAVSVVMPISLDHQAFLGDSVELVATEKAGILKRGRPAVVGFQQFDAALDVLVSTAERLGCPLWTYGQDYSAHEEFGRMIYQDETGLADLPLPALPGRHQLANAAAAIRAVRAAGFALSDEAIERAMSSVEWPGRMQRLTEGRLPAHAPPGAEIWVDGGHNPGAAEVIAEALAELEERRPRPLFLIVGMINTKDSLNYFRPFEGLVERVYTVPIRGTDAMTDPVVLATSAYDAGLVGQPMGSIVEALEEIRSIASDPDRRAPRILICGSLYLAGNALADNETPPV
ncbi:bifunctional folylpolyglutamate synthase/dihydrofolate synthase [Rhizobiaceae bacterium BDR2-2]|uniref:tetrahydrofolate synthase n=1 Tax=Ectorhizobium quercum TaxID=2965071 RepID=A0AAE3SYF1_9HYPH|nr:folylpolyglutamate synthase/dihydrofolate synthase family protein [Ectorhizobium quercum]MCX8999475.1 bifunctional folylpolyglutamate synthase/dihydrofolate synthase [Ectorhizobium quercum]